MPTDGTFGIMAAGLLAGSGYGSNHVGKPKRNRSKNKASKKARRKNR